MRVLHLPTTVGAHASGLKASFTKLGVQSEVWTLNQNFFNFPADKVITKASDSPVIRMLKTIRAGFYVFGRWDIVQFNAGNTLFSMRYFAYNRKVPSGWLKTGINILASFLQRCEIGILRARRIPLFMYYQGDDARQGDISRRLFSPSIAEEVESDYYTPETDEFKRQQIRFLTKRCVKTYAVNPDLMHFLPATAEFQPYSHVDIDSLTPQFPFPQGRPLRFIHAPSHRLVKGTEYILSALEDLRRDGYDFEVTLVEGVSHDEAFNMYKEADVLIDQVIAGWYGGVAVEAMAQGKPVVAFIREGDLDFLPPEMADELPILRATKANLKDDLRKVLEMSPEEIREAGRKSRSYVERWHDPLRIARQVVADYEQAIARR